ncbi:hypothetical protein RIF29_19072 [Crotalaria pallida]|uniref:Uncharacterized protein n=1 Tax=Crotalaria pallida TaxID=3830 RepID=A0AAN9F2R1_CROPI
MTLFHLAVWVPISSIRLRQNKTSSSIFIQEKVMAITVGVWIWCSRIWNKTWLASFFYKPCNYELFVKQSLNMEMAIVMAREVIIDDDEMLNGLKNEIGEGVALLLSTLLLHAGARFSPPRHRRFHVPPPLLSIVDCGAAAVLPAAVAATIPAAVLPALPCHSATGLNRCRKSCRLRWLNYLNPNIMRGMFKEDEVDLILRLHRLLGNRWSLIAGRLPGRTPNDVKNYWNSYIRKKVSSHKENVNNTRPKESVIEPHIVIKPQPRTISRTSPWLRENLLNEDQCRVKQYTHDRWGTMLEDIESNEKNDTCWLGEQDVALLKYLNWNGSDLFSLATEVENFLGEGQSWSDVLDMNW